MAFDLKISERIIWIERFARQKFVSPCPLNGRGLLIEITNTKDYMELAFYQDKSLCTLNGRVPSMDVFQSRGFIVKLVFVVIRFALSPAVINRLNATRKWYIRFPSLIYSTHAHILQYNYDYQEEIILSCDYIEGSPKKNHPRFTFCKQLSMHKKEYSNTYS